MKRFLSKSWRLAVATSALIAGTMVASIVPEAGSGKDVRRERASAKSPTGHIPANHLSSVVDRRSGDIILCQAPSPAAPCPVPYIDCIDGPCDLIVNPVTPFEFEKYAQGEYVGRARIQHVPEYRLRVDDQLNFIYRLTRDETREPYKLNVGDEIRIESFSEKSIDRSLVIQPDGTVSLPFLGQVRAAQHTIAELRDSLEDQFKKVFKEPAIIISPIKLNTKLDDLRNSIGGRSGLSPQVLQGKVTPAGEVTLPAIGTVPAQNLTLPELKAEIDARYAPLIEGIEVTPILMQRAPRFVYVLGEVKQPGRYTLEAPTTIMQAISLAGSWNFGAQVQQVIVFRRADDWRLIATALDLRAALLGREPCPAGEIWVSDSDLIILPKTKIQLTDNWIEMIFTKGLYGIFPFSGSVSYTQLSTFLRRFHKPSEAIRLAAHPWGCVTNVPAIS